MLRKVKYVFIAVVSGVVMMFSGCILFHGPLVDSITETTYTPVFDGIFPGTLTMQDSLLQTPFAKGNVTALELTRSNFRVEYYYSVYQSEPSDPEDPDHFPCDYSPSNLRADYESQLGCDVVYDGSATRGDVQIVLTDLSNLNLGTDEYDKFSKVFSWQGKTYTIQFGADFSGTGAADTSPFNVLIIEHSILFPDALGTISF